MKPVYFNAATCMSGQNQLQQEQFRLALLDLLGKYIKNQSYNHDS